MAGFHLISSRRFLERCQLSELFPRCTSLRLGVVERHVFHKTVRADIYCFFPVPAPWRIYASYLCTNCPCTLSVSKQCWANTSDRLLWSGMLPLRLLEHQLQRSLLAIELGATSSLLLQYFKCLSSARLGDLLRGYTWESLSLFECAPSQLLLAARQV